jgi:hypothetical protein
MIAALIFAISVVTLLQFFVFYCRALIAESLAHALSNEAREICGITSGPVPAGHFERIEQLIAMCPDPGGDGFAIRAISVYFRLICVAHTILSWAIPSVASWVDAERGGCAHAAAVALDRRIAYNRMLMAQQTNH